MHIDTGHQCKETSIAAIKRFMNQESVYRHSARALIRTSGRELQYVDVLVDCGVVPDVCWGKN